MDFRPLNDSERRQLISALRGNAESDQDGQSFLAAFQQELRNLGWAEGRHNEIDVRWAAGDVELMKQFAKELVARQPGASGRRRRTPRPARASPTSRFRPTSSPSSPPGTRPRRMP